MTKKGLSAVVEEYPIHQEQASFESGCLPLFNDAEATSLQQQGGRSWGANYRRLRAFFRSGRIEPHCGPHACSTRIQYSTVVAAGVAGPPTAASPTGIRSHAAQWELAEHIDIRRFSSTWRGVRTW
jgi:hypothetical protein